MCGIAGAVGKVGQAVVAEMVDTIGHRGPDDRGLCTCGGYTLGHARLSILDIEGGAQPMSAPEHQAHVAYNGEIYNYRALRKQADGCTFRTRSDTETLLHLERGGDDHAWLRDLDGMFAFAMVRPEGLMLARDPLGIKPLYVGRSGSTGLFASEFKAILKAGGERIAEFPPGHYYTPREGVRRYYRLQAPSPDIGQPRVARAELVSRLAEAVRTRLMADVPVGVFLSGGLDSSLIAAVAARFKYPLDTFAVGTTDSADLATAREVAAYLGTRHHERVFTIEEALEVLPTVIYHLESFDCALVRSAIPNYFLAELASQHVKVALSGEGADELFAGYSYLKSLGRDDLNRELHAITRALHNTNLQRCDRMSMAHGLEVRVPLLDDLRVVEYAFRLAPGLKLHGPERTEKWILRRAAEEFLPENIAWRPKAKFAAGSGLADHLGRVADRQITAAEFEAERCIPAPVALRSKEELLYYRIFRDLFPPDKVAHLVGRSRSV